MFGCYYEHDCGAWNAPYLAGIYSVAVWDLLLELLKSLQS